VSNKITPIHDKIFVCRSGSAADTQAISDFVIYYLDMHGIELGELPLVNTASNLVQQIIYQNKDNLLASMIVAGWDSALGGQVYCVPLGGVRVRQPIAIGGSGSTYIYGYCDANFKEKMTKEEALSFVRNGIHSLLIISHPSFGSGHGKRWILWRCYPNGCH
jgi:20S proteasome subunit beta 1